MATEASQPLVVSRVAGEDLSAAQFKFVCLTDTGTVELADAATDIPLGVLQNNPESGEAATVVVVGVTKVEAGAELDEGDLIGTANDGQAVPYVAGTDTTSYIVGQVLEPAGAAAVIGTAVVNCASPSRGA